MQNECFDRHFNSKARVPAAAFRYLSTIIKRDSGRRIRGEHYCAASGRPCVAWKNIRHLKTRRAQASVEIGSRVLRLRFSPLLFYRSTGSIDIHVPRTWEKPFHVAELSHSAFTRFNPCRRLPIRQRPLVSAAIIAKDKSFHSAAIIVDATADSADISPGGGSTFRSSAKRLYLLIEQALNRSDSRNFLGSVDFNFKRIFTCCRITVPPLSFEKLYVILSFELFLRNYFTSHRRNVVSEFRH